MGLRASARPASVTVLAILLAAAAACSSDNDEPTGASASSPDSLLMVATAESATFGERDNGSELVLAGAGQDVTFFSDRPNRIAGSWDTGRFFEFVLPASSDGDGPANASVVWQEDGEDQTVIVELGDAVYDGSTVTIDIDVLDTDPTGSTQLAEVPTDSVGPVWLFIDSVKTSWASNPDESCTLYVENLTDTTFELSRAWDTYTLEPLTGGLDQTITPLGGTSFSESAVLTWCVGTIEYNFTNGELAFAYTFSNQPTTIMETDSTWSFYCHSSLTCYDELVSDTDALTNRLYLCPGDPDACLSVPPAQLPVGTVPGAPVEHPVNEQITD